VVQLLTDQLRLMAAHLGGEVGYRDVSADRQLTFAEWEARSNQLARGLVAAGVAKGDRVAVYLAPQDALDWIVAYAAVHKAGAVAVPTNTRLASPELSYVLGHCEASVVLVSPRLRASVEAARPGVPSLRLVAAPPWAGLAADGADAASEFQVPVEGDDLAEIMYTSGTTGRAKGVVVRHRNASLIPNGLPNWTGAGWLHCSPLFTFAGISNVYNPMKLGMTALYMPRFDAGPWLDVVEREHPVAVFLVPAMAQLLLAHSRFESADLGSVRMCMLGSAPLPVETQRRLALRMPEAMVTNGYGMTEAGPAYCSTPADQRGKRVGSVGKPVPPVEFRIVGDDGGELPAGEIGEIVIFNPGREREYYRDPQATASTWRDGGLYTGDLGYVDPDGYVYVVGRKKDVIIRGGNNVHAGDVEAVILQHSAVLEAAVAGIPHPVLGEDVAAWVVLRPEAAGAVTDEELRDFCAARIADYKVPRRITFVDALPRNATGKVVKSALPPVG